MVSEVRIGEAAHPGPPKLILRGVQVNRFDVLAREAEDENIPSQDFQDHRSVSEDGSQDGASIADAEREPDEVVERVEFLQFAPAGRRIGEGFASLDDVDLMQLFRRRGHVMRSVPQVMKGAYTAAMRISMEEVLRSKRVHDVEAEVRAWKLFLLLPRMFLVPTRKRWQGVELSSDGASRFVLQRSMGPIDRTQQSDLTRSCVHQHTAKTSGGWFRLGTSVATAQQLAALGELSAGTSLLSRTQWT